MFILNQGITRKAFTHSYTKKAAAGIAGLGAIFAMNVAGWASAETTFREQTAHNAFQILLSKSSLTENQRDNVYAHLGRGGQCGDFNTQIASVCDASYKKAKEVASAPNFFAAEYELTRQP